MPKPKHKPTDTPPAHTSIDETGVNAVLSGLALLAKNGSYFTMAAIVDWIRQEWRGNPKVLITESQLAGVSHWIAVQASMLRNDAALESGKSALVAAVTS